MEPATYLFTPGDRPDRFAKSIASGADAVILDLEDAVAPSAKAAARSAIAVFVNGRATAPVRIFVRINDVHSPFHSDDLVCLENLAVDGVFLPKAECAEDISQTAARLPGVDIVALIESAAGVAGLDAIARAPRVERLAFGTLDYAVDLGLSGDPIGLIYPACRMAIASKCAGIAPPIAGVTAAIDDTVQLAADIAFARACGFTAKMCIHPKQIAAVAAAFAPSDQEIAWARRVLEIERVGQGTARLDGAMVDRPVILKAQAILARAARRGNAAV